MASNTPDVLVVGAGPAGTSAALWSRSLGLSVRLIEAGSQSGGQLQQVHFEPTNFPGSIPGDGGALAERMVRQLAAAGIDRLEGVRAVSLDAAAPAVRDEAGRLHRGTAILIATGVRRRTLEIPGERQLEGRGVSYSATLDRPRFADQEMLVVGGGDAAYENALLLSEVGCTVTVVVRNRPRARREFRERLAADPNIEVLEDTRVAEVLGDSQVRAVRLENERGAFELPVAGLVIKIGVTPNSEWCAGALERDAEGFILVDERLGTSQARVWAAGDVTRPLVFGVAVALGHGALAAAAIRDAFREPDGPTPGAAHSG
ncbi:MAG TPA: NAD(P)/FAD-dependent oxidoreductase [Candidatus Limnocylindria bacterium]|nr:NAD(P)/FAD-dependent oxidoreductase [Candidatus Limnocylindria bacterium]